MVHPFIINQHLNKFRTFWISSLKTKHRKFITYFRQSINWIGHILRRNCLLKQVIEGKIEGDMEVTRRQERRRKQLLDDLKNRRGYCHLKEEAVDRNMWRDRFGRGFEPVVRQTAGWWWLSVPISLKGKSVSGNNAGIFRRNLCPSLDYSKIYILYVR